MKTEVKALHICIIRYFFGTRFDLKKAFVNPPIIIYILKSFEFKFIEIFFIDFFHR